MNYNIGDIERMGKPKAATWVYLWDQKDKRGWECKVLLITPRIEKNNNLEITIAVRKPKELSLDKLIKLVQSVSVKDA